MEVLLTMALLVLITAMTWPALERPFATQRLRRAADKVRAQWCGARVEAMGSGRVYVFQYTPGANSFRIQSQSCAESSDDIWAEDAAAAVGVGQSAATGSGLGAPLLERTLPEGITFLVGETALDSRAALLQPQSEATTSLDVSWSEPIFFYPDGTTSTARLVLQNQYGRCVELMLRGLTGTAAVGDVYASEEGL